jgi:phenylalanyl-tRNA synthetase beta chain
MDLSCVCLPTVALSSDLLRYEIAAAGFDEVLTLALCSIEENYGFLRHEYKLGDAVVLANPQSEEFQV